MQVKLTMRSVPMPGGAPSVPKPFLTFTCRGPNLNMVQDLPISKPHMPARAPAPTARVCPPSPAHEPSISLGMHAAAPHPLEACTVEAKCLVLQPSAGHVQASLRLGGGAEIDRLVADKDITQLCPFYVDLQVEGPRLQVPPPLQSRYRWGTSTSRVVGLHPQQRLHSTLPLRIAIIAVFPMQQELCQILVVQFGDDCRHIAHDCIIVLVQALVNKMKSISSTLTLVTTKHGHLHLQVAAEQVHFS